MRRDALVQRFVQYIFVSPAKNEALLSEGFTHAGRRNELRVWPPQSHWVKPSEATPPEWPWRVTLPTR